MIIAVDFDGTCVTHEFPRVGAEIGAAEVLKELPDTGLIVSGGFGNAIMTMYGDRLTETFREVIVTNGGIRLGNEALIFKDKLLCKNWIFIDDSYYLGRTRAGISVALRKIRPDASIFETYVIYDGSMGRADKVKSMYRYNR